MYGKIKHVLGILLGFALSFFNAYLLKNSTTKRMSNILLPIAEMYSYWIL